MPPLPPKHGPSSSSAVHTAGSAPSATVHAAASPASAPVAQVLTIATQQTGASPLSSPAQSSPALSSPRAGVDAVPAASPRAADNGAVAAVTVTPVDKPRYGTMR